MSTNDEGTASSRPDLESALADLTTPAPVDFGLRVLRHVGISPGRYDRYVHLPTDAGGLYVAFSPLAVTGSTLESMVVSAEMFEEVHWSRTRRTAIRDTTPFPGLRPALRTGRAKALPIDLGGLDEQQCAVLEAVRTVPRGQLRPISWIAREAGLPSAREAGLPSAGEEAVVAALAANPATLLVPCHRITYEDGSPCDAAYLPGTGRALRAAEDIDMERLAALAGRGVVLMGSDTTNIYCHPTCAHARRITPPHQRPFHSASEARRAGYRACRSCRPLTV
ncbi:MGMT family protein [Streptomyces sp. NPDC048337]|uniref:MGMT family protein n=1 Tax=Streptomyces sp. NPDC048337 TaxID=3365535 RepID=UPI0037238296